MKKNTFELLLDAIEQVRADVKGLTFEQAIQKLDGFNVCDELFDYQWDIDGNRYIIGTIENNNGKASMDAENSFYELWEMSPGCFSEQALAMTENEIREQVERLE